MDSHRVTPGIYDDVYDTLLAIPSHLVLAQANYQTDFVRQPGRNGTWDYKDPQTNVPYETIIVGEIKPALCGTKFSAKGNHYAGSPLKPTFIDDNTRVKSLFVLGKPTDCPQQFTDLFDNQTTTLSDVIDVDTTQTGGANKSISIKEWTGYDGGDTGSSPDYINVVTDMMYAVPKQGAPVTVVPRKKHTLVSRSVPEPPKLTTNDKGKGRRGKTCKPIDSSERTDVPMEDDMTGKNVASSSTENVEPSNGSSTQHDRTTNDLYHPSVLADYGGDLFKHTHSKLKQLDFRDVNDRLIPPEEWYSALRQGTLVMVRASLHAFNWDTRRVYQINAHTIKVLDSSQLDVEIRKPTVLPSSAGVASTSSAAANAVSNICLGKRQRDEA